MVPPKVPWRKFPRLGKGVVICTRLISSVAIGAGKKCRIKRGSVRTICLSKCPDRTGKGRGVIGLASNSNHAPPGQALGSIILTKRWIRVIRNKRKRQVAFSQCCLYSTHTHLLIAPSYFLPLWISHQQSSLPLSD